MKYSLSSVRAFAAAASSLFLAVFVLGACASQSTPPQVASAPTDAPTQAPAAAVAATAPVPQAGATGAAGTPAPRATLVQPAELPSKGAKDAPVTIIEFSDFQ